MTEELRSISLTGQDEKALLLYRGDLIPVFEEVAVLDGRLNVLTSCYKTAADGAKHYTYELMQIDESGDADTPHTFSSEYIYDCFMTANTFYYSVVVDSADSKYGQLIQKNLDDGDTTVLYESDIGSIANIVKKGDRLLFNEFSPQYAYTYSRVRSLSLDDGSVATLYEGYKSAGELGYLATVVDDVAYISCSKPSDGVDRYVIRRIDLSKGSVEDMSTLSANGLWTVASDGSRLIAIESGETIPSMGRTIRFFDLEGNELGHFDLTSVRDS